MASDPAQPWTTTEHGLRLAVRISPRAARDAVEGIGQGADGRPELRIRIAAPPVEGEANAALIAFLAKGLGLAKRDLSIRSGATGRLKIIDIAGDPHALGARIAAWID